jgi:hypothetical protein
LIEFEVAVVAFEYSVQFLGVVAKHCKATSEGCVNELPSTDRATVNEPIEGL